MYTQHFGLTELPFSIAPNPRYLYLTDQHQEALAHLVYGIHGEGGIILLTGEVGTGKTTISRKLLEDMPENIEIAWIVNPRLSVEELLATICDELSIAYPDGCSSIKTFTDLISARLIEAHGLGRNVVLMIDEAQNLSPEVLEQLRLLTNLETSERKLLQIMLFGQPELKQMLERTDLRQLAQRITARYHLQPLSRLDTGEYIRYRLAVGGCNKAVFSQQAIHLIHRFSHGTPRLINLICDRALLGAYSRNANTVKPAHVRQASREVLGEVQTPTRSFLIPVTTMILVFVAGVLLTTGVGNKLPDLFKQLAIMPLEQAPAPESAAKQVQAVTESVQPATPLPAKHIAAHTPPIAEAEAASGIEQRFAAVSITAEPNIAQTEQKAQDNPASTEPAAPIPDSLWQSMEQAGSKALAFRTLTDIWQTEISAEHGRLCDQLIDKKLFCLQQRAKIWLLRTLNRPVMFHIIGSDGRDRYAVVRAIDKGHAVIQLGEHRWRISLSELKQRWQNQITLIWIKPPGYEKDIRQHDSGETVEWLARQLDRIQGTMIPPVHFRTMNALLVERLKDFQKSQGLPPDGIAGPQTLIRMNEQTGLDAPSLNSRESS